MVKFKGLRIYSRTVFKLPNDFLLLCARLQQFLAFSETFYTLNTLVFFDSLSCKVYLFLLFWFVFVLFVFVFCFYFVRKKKMFQNVRYLLGAINCFTQFLSIKFSKFCGAAQLVVQTLPKRSHDVASGESLLQWAACASSDSTHYRFGARPTDNRILRSEGRGAICWPVNFKQAVCPGSVATQVTAGFGGAGRRGNGRGGPIGS